MAEPGPQSDRALIGEVEQFLSTLVADLPPDVREQPFARRGRPRILPSMCLWSALLVCVLRGFSSQMALWRLLAVQGLWHYPRFPVSDQAIYKRLAQAGTEPLQHLFANLTALLAERLEPWCDRSLAPFASDVLAIDATTLDPLVRLLANPTDPGAPTKVLPGRLLGLFDVRRQQWRQLLHRPDPNENEKARARRLLVGLAGGTLVLGDLGFFSFEWFDGLTDAGHWWISRLRSRTSLEVVHTFYQDGDTRDQLAWLGRYRADRAKHMVRLVQYRHADVIHRYVTNVLEPSRLSLRDIAVLYARRWDIEMAVQLVKQHLGVRLWWSNNLTVVQHQLWATLIISQVLMALRWEIASRAGVGVFDVSMQLMVQYLPIYAAQGEDPVAAFVRDGRLAKFIRPSRRTVIRAPSIDPADIVAAPPDLVLHRTPHYARRRCEHAAQPD